MLLNQSWIVAILLLVAYRCPAVSSSYSDETSQTTTLVNVSETSSQTLRPPQPSVLDIIAHLHRFRSRLPSCPPIRATSGAKCPRGWRPSTRNNTRSCSLPNLDNISPCAAQSPWFFMPRVNLDPMKSVSCSGLKLNCLGSVVFPGDAERIDLKHNLLADGNHLKQILTHLSYLKQVDISSNDFQRLPESLFQHNQALQEVRFERNFISYIPEDTFYGNSNLTAVYFGGNRLQILPWFLFSVNFKLRVADFSHNKLKDFPMDLFYDNTLLEAIDFSQNFLSEISEECFIPNPILKEVDLSANNLSSIPALLFEYNTELVTLKLSHNRIQNLSPAFLQNCLDLEYLSLSYNMLEDLPLGWLQSNSKLRHLDLIGNMLTHISNDFFSNHPLLTVLGINNQSNPSYSWYPHASRRTQNNTLIQRLPVRSGGVIRF